MKKKLAYLLACSDGIAFAAGNVAISLNKYMPNKEFDIVIYNNGYQEKNKSALLKIPKVILRDFNLDPEFVSFMLSEEGLPSAQAGGRWKNKSKLFSFIHFEIFNLLNEYETVIWLDVDMSIQADISELENYGPLGISKDLNWNTVWTVGDQFFSPVPGYDMNLPGYCNACIVVNDKLENYDKLAKYCYDTAIKYASQLKNIDQSVFQLMLQDFNLVPKQIPWNDYCCHAQHELAAIAKIVHFGTERKIWNDESYLRCFPEWFRVHLEWLALGGMDFDRSVFSLKSIWYDLYGRGKLSETKQLPENFKTRFTIFQIPIFVLTELSNGFSLKVLGIPLIKKRANSAKTSYNLLNKLEIFTKKEINGKLHFYLFGIKICTYHKYRVLN